jgi:hypothetical protein
MFTRRAFIEGAALVAMSEHALGATESGTEDLVLIQSGQLPIILTAPHGGSLTVPGVAPREVAGRPTTGGSSYVVGQDVGTERLARGIAAQIKAITQKDVFLVVARFHRKFIDANRAPAVAFDNAAAKPTYDRYHQAIRSFVDEIGSRFSAGMLLDLHAQKAFPDALVRGTHNGSTVTRLMARAGVAAVTGPQGLFGQFERNGFRVLPGNDVPPSGKNEDYTGFNGGHTTYRYGSHRPGGIDAAQCEFGRQYLERAELELSIRKAATAIATFYRAHLA